MDFTQLSWVASHTVSLAGGEKMMVKDTIEEDNDNAHVIQKNNGE